MNWDHEEPLLRGTGESIRANGALRNFAQLGPGRSLKKLKRTYADRSAKDPIPPTQSLSVLKNWSSKYHWQERVAAFDEALFDQEAELWRERWEVHREKEWAAIEKLRERLAQMLKMPLLDTSHSEDGKTTIVKAVRWNWGDVARIAETVSRLARLAAGKSLGRFEFDPERMTNEQLLRRYQTLHAQITAGWPAAVGGPTHDDEKVH